MAIQPQLLLYQVSSSRKLGLRDYDIEALIEAVSHLRAAQRFLMDWLEAGLPPTGVIAVNRTCGGPIFTFVVVGNMVSQEVL